MAENETIRQEGEAAGAYHAYLLRCWQESDSGESAWRFTLVGVGEEHTPKGFASLEDLFAYLRAELENKTLREKLLADSPPKSRV